jgi:hypothetical protein
MTLSALIAISSLSVSPAIADNKVPTPAASTDLVINYKIALEKYRGDLRIFEEKRRAINLVFKEAIEKALSDARTASALNQSQMKKRQNMSAKQEAVIEAISARDAAIETLGPPPIEPMPPAKPAKSEKLKKPKP